MKKFKYFCIVLETASQIVLQKIDKLIQTTPERTNF